MKQKTFNICFGAFALGFAVVLGILCQRMGYIQGEDVYHHEATCQLIKNITGGYDMVKFDKYIIVSQYNWIDLAGIKGPGKAAGGLFLLDITNPNDTQLTKLELQKFPEKTNFHPAGIDLLGNKLFVVNHGLNKGGERLEVFQLNATDEGVSVVHVKGHSLGGQEVNGIFNDILAIDSSSVYLTQWREPVPQNILDESSRLTMMTQKMKLIGGVTSSMLYHYKLGGKLQKLPVTKGGSIKGITRNGSSLWISDSLWKLKKFDIKKPAEPKLLKEIKTENWLESISYDPDSKKIYGAYYSKPFQYFSWVKRSIQAGKILRDYEVASGVYEVEQDGDIDELIRTDKITVSSALRVGKYLVLGSCCDHGMLKCKYIDEEGD